MRKTLIAILMALALVVIPVGSVLAANSADVTVTATPTYIALTNSTTTWPIGMVSENQAGTYWWKGSAPSFPLGDAGCTSTITNTGNVAENINVHAHNFLGGVGWTLANTVGLNQVVLKVAASGCADEASMLKLLDGADQELTHELASSGTKMWEMHLETGTFGDGVAKSGTVTLTAVQHIP